MSHALNATGRPILYSMCNWGGRWPVELGDCLFTSSLTPNAASYAKPLPQTIANSWRISGDIVDVCCYTAIIFLHYFDIFMLLQAFDRYDDRCPCTSVIDCKLAGYRVYYPSLAFDCGYITFASQHRLCHDTNY